MSLQLSANETKLLNGWNDCLRSRNIFNIAHEELAVDCGGFNKTVSVKSERKLLAPVGPVSALSNISEHSEHYANQKIIGCWFKHSLGGTQTNSVGKSLNTETDNKTPPWCTMLASNQLFIKFRLKSV